MRIRELGRGVFSGFERTNDGRAALGLDRKHPWPFFADPTEFLHFIERFPHSNKAGSATGGINNDVGQFPIQLLGQFVTERFLSLDPVWLLERRDIKPVLFAPPDLSSTIGNKAVDQSDAGTELAAFNDVGSRCVARHEDVGFESGTRGVGGEGAGGVAGTWSNEFGGAEMFRHRNGDGHPTRLKALSRIL